MPTQVPTNRSFSVTRKGTASATLTHLPALALPARPEIVALQDVPSNKLFEIIFDNAYAIAEQDVLVSDADSTETYRVLGISTFDTPHAAHTEVTAEKQWGS